MTGKRIPPDDEHYKTKHFGFAMVCFGIIATFGIIFNLLIKLVTKQ